MSLLEIGFRWNGELVDEAAIVRLHLQAVATGWQLHVDAPYYSDPAPSHAPGPTPALWEYEVVELFVVGLAKAEQPIPYTEIELGPHGHHLVLQLEGVRNPVKTELPLDYEATIRGDRWMGVAQIPHRLLPACPVRMNAYAIHGVAESREYLAMTPVPGPHPDFHRLDAFGPWVAPW